VAKRVGACTCTLFLSHRTIILYRRFTYFQDFSTIPYISNYFADWLLTLDFLVLMEDNSKYRVLITGVSGFLGRNLAKQLACRHPRWSIDGLDLQYPDEQLCQTLDKFIHADIRSQEAVNAAFENYHPDIVLHAAGLVPSRQFRYSTRDEDWQQVKSVNVDGTVNVLRATMASGCKRFVYTSSVTAIIDDLEHDYYNMNETTQTGLATLHYGRSKGLAEAFVLSPEHAEKGLQVCVLRPCPIIGPDETEAIGLIYDLIAKKETCFIIGDGNNLCDWLYIDNAVHAHVLAIENLLPIGPQTAAGQVFFITNQEPAYFWDVLLYIWAQFGHTPRFRVHIPVTLAVFIAALLEFITWLTGTPATLHRGSIKDAIRIRYADNGKSIRVLGYRPKIGLAEGLRRSCNGYKNQLAAKAKSENGHSGGSCSPDGR
jgi:sterol-4alpha-carboxylate 3-dehydrogenase (decarboxylating)